VTHQVAACIYDDGFGCQQRFDVFKQQETFIATRNQARRWCIQHAGCAFNLRHQRRDTSFVPSAFGPCQSCARLSCTQTTHCDARNHELVESPRRGREKTRIEASEQALRFVQASDQKELPDFKIARKTGVQAVAMRFEGRPRGVEHFRRPGQIARGERDFGLCYYASRTCHGFSWTEGAGSATQEFLGSCEIA
jgi:hypothetical protein